MAVSRETPDSPGAADAPGPWYADGLRFSCTQCGNCCGGAPGYVWVSDEEAAALAERLQLPLEEFARKHLRRVGADRLSLREKRNGDCEFLLRDAAGKARCGVYEARPVQCRTWPFWKSNLASRREWDAAARACPGMNKGAHHALPVIQAAVAANGALPL